MLIDVTATRELQYFMELSAYIRLLRRWFWLVGLVAVVFGSVSFIVSRSEPLQYQASTTIQVGAYLNLANPNTGMIQTGEQLAQTYAALIKTRPVLQATIDKLQLPFTPEDLSRLAQTRIITNTSLLTITVIYTDPVVVADIANELAKQLIANSPTNLTQDQQQQLNLLRGEIDKAQTQLKNARDELSIIDKALSAGATDDRAVALTARRTELINQINAAQANLAQMSSTVSTLQQEGNINSLTVVEPAVIPDNPVGPSSLVTTLGATIVGIALAIGVALLIEYLNDSVRTPSEVTALFNVGPIGTIAPFGKRGTYKDKLITWIQPRSTLSEAYRAMRVNLMYAEKDRDIEGGCRKYIISSPGPQEGKSVTVANLAVTFAQTGMRVLLIDADLRRPAQHLLFNLSNVTGLSSLWSKTDPGKNEIGVERVIAGETASGMSSKDSIIRHKLTLSLPYIVQKTFVPGLDVITSGPTPPNPSELLGTSQMQELILQLEDSKHYDVILFDTPPMLVVSDTNVLANVTQSGAILIIQAGHTRRGSVARSVEQMTALSIQLLGIVINRLNPHDLDSGYGQYYYYGYYGYGQNIPPVETGTAGEDGHK